MKRVNKNRIKKDPPIKQVKQENKQTALSGGGYNDKVIAYRDLHIHALFSSLARMIASPFSSIMTIAVLAIAISLASCFYIVVANIHQLTGSIETSNQISLFLKEEVSDAHAKKMVENIRSNQNVQSVKLITKEQALEEFKEYSGFGDAINAIKKNPLPIVLQVLPKNSLYVKQGLDDLLKGFKQLPEVDFAQFDLQWVDRLQAIVDVAQVFASLLNSLLAAAVLFIIGNTVRLEFYSRRAEVVISKLVGATNAFIRRPFLYTGFWMGFISGVSAWFIVTILMLILRGSVERLSGLYDGTMHLLFLDFTETLFLISTSSLMGVLGAWVVLFYELKSAKS